MLKSESKIMYFFRRIGLERIAWSLRRLYCPVSEEALVLEVGSGGNPYWRSNVLLDAYEMTRQRHWAQLVTDRPTVLGFVENLPFKDNVFDFVIASHVLEHSMDPERFLSELQRVAKAGYIECPDAFMERIIPYHDHRLEITMRDSRLLLRKKVSWMNDPDLVELCAKRAKPFIAGKLIPSHPFAFHVRYYWRDNIQFELINPDADAGWPEVKINEMPIRPASLRSRLSGVLLKVVRAILSQKKRNKQIDLTGLMRCPSCCSGNISRADNQMICSGCGRSYPVSNGIPLMTVADNK